MPSLDLSAHHLGQDREAAKALQSIFSAIESLSSDLAKYIPAGSGLYTTDFLVLAAAKRTLSLGRAFLAMMEVPNFGVAAALLRMQLDTALRFSALACVKSQDDFAMAMLRGDRIDKMVSNSGQRLTDKFLVGCLSKAVPWVEGVYNETSGFIHLSGRHIWQTFSALNEDERKVQLQVSAEDVRRPASEYVEIVQAFESTTNLVISMLTSWLETKPRAAFDSQLRET
jgi:hypothetical protein